MSTMGLVILGALLLVLWQVRRRRAPAAVSGRGVRATARRAGPGARRRGDRREHGDRRDEIRFGPGPHDRRDRRDRRGPEGWNHLAH